MRIRLAGMLALVLVAASGAADGDAKEALPPLAYASDGPSSLDVFVTGASGVAGRRLTSSPRDGFSPSWSPDGRRIAYRVNPRRGDTGDI